MTVDEPSEFGLRVTPTRRAAAMTEEEWLTPGDLSRHVALMWAEKRARKLRLFGVACCRQLDPWVDEPVLHEALARAERFADGELSGSTIGKWRLKVNRLADERRRANRAVKKVPQEFVYQDVAAVCLEPPYTGFADAWWTLVHGRMYGDEFARTGPGLAHKLLLDIFGNPFRPVAFDAAWRTSTAVALARQMYESRDFSAMPILADALQDA